MTNGFLVGKFAPLTTGHIHFINTAATMVDNLYVILSYDGKRFDNDPILSKRNRLLWLKDTFKDLNHIKILCVDETNLAPYPNGWESWAGLVKQALGDVKVDKIFSSEPEYGVGFNKYWPDAEHVIVDAERSKVNISATMVREDPYKYWAYMPSIVRQFYVKKVLIIGTESCGKTTLTKMLAKYFQTSWVEEYGRTYCETVLCGDESLLVSNDYAKIATHRYELEQQALRTANKLLIVDTSAVVTNYYHSLYGLGVNDIVKQFEYLENYDLIIYLDADVPWVADGLRLNPDRERTTQHFEAYLGYCAPAKYSVYKKVSGSYQERYTKTISLIEELL